jgi:hypothetical protein
MGFLHQTLVIAADSTNARLRIVHPVGTAMAWANKLCAPTMVAVLFLFVPASADTNYAESSLLTESQWDVVRERVGLLDKIAYLPSLLPVIMKHRDTLALTDEQIAAFRQWRKLHYQNMVDLMNEIIQRRIKLSKASLEVGLSSDEILAKQEQIFRLQERLLRIRLSCRNLIVKTFSSDQWENMAFILEEYPRYAGLLDEWQDKPPRVRTK